MAEETKHDLMLKRVQVIIAILGGLAALILGIYNVKKDVLSKKNPETPPPVIVQKNADSPIKSALEDVGASWIKKLGKAEEK